MPTRLAPKPPEIGNLDGFDKHDLFRAKGMGARLADILCDLEGPAVIAIDGSWGTGKTTFVRQWAGMLRQRRHPVVYFDAFEHDHLDDPFMALFTHLLDASATPDEPILMTHRDQLIRAVTPLVKPVLGSVGDAALHRASLGLIDPQDIRGRIASANDKEPSDPTAVVADAVRQIGRQAGRVEAFREALSDCVSELGQSKETDTESDAVAPLIFIVDELDRCRPSYALSLLERIKHVFSTDHVCFVLVTNVDSLADMAEKTYGFKNGREYLQKFYHRRIDISSVLRSESQSPGDMYLDHLAAKLGIDWTAGRYDRIVLENLVRVHDVSLRGQERIMTSFGLLQESANFFEYQIMAASLCVMRLVQPDLFAAAKKGAIPYDRTKPFLGMDSKWQAADEVQKCWREFAGVVADQGRYSWGRWGASEDEYRRQIAMICGTIELFQPRGG